MKTKAEDDSECDLFDIEPLKLWEKLYLVPKWKFQEFSYWLRKLRQKITTGFAHEESWNFYSHLCAWALPRLKFFRKNLRSHPCLNTNDYPYPQLTFDFFEKAKNEDTDFEKWKNIIDKIIWAMENFDKEPDPIYPENYKHGFRKVGEDKRGSLYAAKDERSIDFTPVFEHQKKVQEGFELFGKYLRHLWD